MHARLSIAGSVGPPPSLRSRGGALLRVLLAGALPLAGLASAGCGAGEGDGAGGRRASTRPELPAGPAPGTELVALYFGATTCRPCRRPEVKEAIREMRRRLERRAAATGRAFASIGVALDRSVPAGVDLLAGTAEFDEIAVGRTWANQAAIQHLWGEPETVPAIPQIIVFEREVRREAGARFSFGPPRVLRRVLGASTLLRWVEEGAPIDG